MTSASLIVGLGMIAPWYQQNSWIRIFFDMALNVSRKMPHNGK
jgi:hypothetical protein